MEQLIQLISAKSGLSPDLSTIIAEAIVDYFEGELPKPGSDRSQHVFKAMALVLGPGGPEAIGNIGAESLRSSRKHHHLIPDV